LARKALYKHATQVDTNTYPDDGSSPVGSNEWNEAPDPQGMLGFTPATATITIASGVATVTDTITVVAAESGTSDTLDKLAITNTNQYDLVYLFADTGDTITLTNTSSPSADGQIRTVSDANETLSTTTPTILIRKGNYWYGYGGGVVNAVSDIGDVTISSIASGELLKWNGSAWINQTLAESGIAAASHSQAASTITDFDTEVANNTAVAANTAKVTNATHSGEVTGSGALTVADDIIDEANLKVDNSPTNDYVLTAKSSAAGGLTWAEVAAGGATATHAYTNQSSTSYRGTGTSGTGIAVGVAVGTEASGAGEREIYIRKIDANNEGVFTVIHKNGTTVEVQIA